MTTKRATLTLALSTALALAGPSAWAQGSRGGHRGSGGHRGGGGSHAVPRGSSQGYWGGGAAGRHPRAGTGAYGYYNRGHYGGYYRPYHHGYYRPYYGGYYGGYYGYYRPYGYASFYFGWPYYGSSWWPYASVGFSYGYPSYAPYVSAYGYDGGSAPTTVERGRSYEQDRGGSGWAARNGSRAGASDDSGRVRLEVRPDDASVYVDDEFWGNAKDSKFLVLRSGVHAVELVRPGFRTERREVDVVRRETRDVFVELQRP